MLPLLIYIVLHLLGLTNTGFLILRLRLNCWSGIKSASLELTISIQTANGKVISIIMIEIDLAKKFLRPMLYTCLEACSGAYHHWTVNAQM